MPRPTLRDVSPYLTALQNVSISYRNPSYIYREVFPVVQVDEKSGYYWTFDKTSWQRERSGVRAPGTRAPRAGYTISTASYVCVNDSLATAVPDEVVMNAQGALRPLINAAQFVSDGLELAEEIRVANLITASANWASNASPTTIWSNDNSDPWGDIDTGTNYIVTSTGRAPNTLVMSWNVWRHLRQHPDFLDRIKYTRPSGRIEPEDLRSWFGFEKVLIGTAVKDTSLEGQTASPTYVWGNVLWMGYVPNTAALEVPAAGYVLVWGQENRVMNRFREDQEHTTVLESGWYVTEKITASDSGYLIYAAA
jgi:hypothetical protein